MAIEQYGVKTNIIPAGGWRYPQPVEGQEPYWLSASGPEELIASVVQWRINQGLPMGDPGLDVANYILATCPQSRLYGWTQVPDPVVKAKPITPLTERARGWVRMKLQKQVRLAVADEPDKNADKCLKCPQNILRWQSTCSPCNDALTYEGNRLRQRTIYKEDVRLGVCRLHGIYLPAAIFLDRDDHPERDEKAPDFCWIKKAP